MRIILNGLFFAGVVYMIIFFIYSTFLEISASAYAIEGMWMFIFAGTIEGMIIRECEAGRTVELRFRLKDLK